MPAGGEEHCDRHPRRPGRFHDHLQPGSRRAPRQRRRLDRSEALDRRPRLAFRDRVPGLVEHPHRVRARDPQIHPDQPSTCHHAAPSRCVVQHRRSDDNDDHDGHGPKEDTLNRGSHSCAANGSDLNGPSHFPHPGHPWPSRTWQSVERGRTNRPSPERSSTPPPETAGMNIQPWNPDVIKHRCSLHERRPVDRLLMRRPRMRRRRRRRDGRSSRVGGRRSWWYVGRHVALRAGRLVAVPRHRARP